MERVAIMSHSFLINKSVKVASCFLAISILWTGCGAPGSENLDDITQGAIAISIDETLADPFLTGIYNFEKINQKAKVSASVLSEQEAYALLLEDSIRLVIGSRQLTEAEKSFFDRKKITPRVTPLGYDAVVFLRASDSGPTLLSWDKMSLFLSGEISGVFSDAPNTPSGEAALVFLGSGAGTMTALQRAFLLDSIQCPTYALNSTDELLNYLKAHPGAIGVVGLAWIQQLGVADMARFEQQVQVLAVNNPDPAVNGYYLPDQGNLADGTYPLTRNILAISREPRVGLGTGFISFMASPRGQRIILKAGLLPYTMPSRELIIYDSDSSGK
jgi:phosphate transport system substrate-binding protein